MKKFILGFGLFVLSTVVFNQAYADPFVPASATSSGTSQLNSSTGVSGHGTAIMSSPVSSTRPQARPTASSSSSTAPAATPAATAPATDGSAGYYQVKLQEPLSGQSSYVSASNGVDLINQYISMIYMWMASIVGILAVLMIVVSGIQIIFGGANPEKVNDAKTRVTQSLLSLVLLFATAMILRTVNPNFFGFM